MVGRRAGGALTLERDSADPSISLLSTVECVSTSALLLSWQGTIGMVERGGQLLLLTTLYLAEHKDVCTRDRQ